MSADNLKEFVNNSFENITIEKLENIDLDSLNYGVIKCDKFTGKITHYNSFESKFAQIPSAHVIGKVFCVEVAPCCNNYRINGRFEESKELDEIIDYVFSYRMKPHKVRLRLIKSTDVECYYILVSVRKNERISWDTKRIH